MTLPETPVPDENVTDEERELEEHRQARREREQQGEQLEHSGTKPAD